MAPKPVKSVMDTLDILSNNSEINILDLGCYYYIMKRGVQLNKKVDYKKDFKHLYLPKTSPEVIEVPSMPFIMVNGSGDPNGADFAKATEALYSLSYAVKMSYKKDVVLAGYYEYTVFPLEGVWGLIDKSIPATVKSNLQYTIMIRQSDFLKM